jgi:hypothetical protein
LTRHGVCDSIVPMKLPFVALAVAGCLTAYSAQQDVAQTPSIVTTNHQVTIAGTVLRYTARAGTIPIRDNETGDAHANMFFVASTVDCAPGAPARPLTFLWNGGPGSNSGLVHLLGFGPKRIAAATGSMPRYSASGTATSRGPRLLAARPRATPSGWDACKRRCDKCSPDRSGSRTCAATRLSAPPPARRSPRRPSG